MARASQSRRERSRYCRGKARGGYRAHRFGKTPTASHLLRPLLWSNAFASFEFGNESRAGRIANGSCKPHQPTSGPPSRRRCTPDARSDAEETTKRRPTKELSKQRITTILHQRSIVAPVRAPVILIP